MLPRLDEDEKNKTMRRQYGIQPLPGFKWDKSRGKLIFNLIRKAFRLKENTIIFKS